MKRYIIPKRSQQLNFANIVNFKFTMIISCYFIFFSASSYSQNIKNIDFQVIKEFSLNTEVGKLRSVLVNLGDRKKGILLSFSLDKEIDPYIEMFYPPTDQMKFVLIDLDGNIIWKKVLGKGVINGMWFTPIYTFDLNNDGVDEIYFVNNTDPVHILGYSHYQLEALNAHTGETMGQWKWNRIKGGASLSHTFRNFIMGGYVNGDPVLITAQGTYGDMHLQAWNSGMEKRWELNITKEEQGARGSHMSPVVDINNDKIDEILWGERCIDMDKGKYVFIADKEVYSGHSDVIMPTLNWKENKWYIFTCRESGAKGQIKPRVVMFDDKGDRVWTDLDLGHMDMGWTAKSWNNEAIAFTISRGGKKAGPDGFFRLDVVEYAYKAYTGAKVELPFKAYNTIPVDLDGDGLHEFACAQGEQSDRNIYNLNGKVLGNIGTNGYVAMASKFLDLPGEQILCYYPDGTIKFWGDKNARDNKQAKKRYSHPYYLNAQKLTATGYNLVNLGGL